MAEPMLHTKIWYLSVSALFFYIWKCVMSVSVLLFLRIWTDANQNVPKAERVRFTCFYDLDLGIASTGDKWHLASPLSSSRQWQCLCTILSKYSKSFKRKDQFHCFQNLNLGQSQMTFDNLLGYILSISMCMQSFITIDHSVRPFSLFQNLELGTASTDVKCHFAISWARFGNPSVYIVSIVMGIQTFIKIYQKVQGIGPVSLFFRIWTSAKPRPISNIIWQTHWLHVVNINVYAKFHHNILHSSRDRAIFRIWSSEKPGWPPSVSNKIPWLFPDRILFSLT